MEDFTCAHTGTHGAKLPPVFDTIPLARYARSGNDNNHQPPSLSTAATAAAAAAATTSTVRWLL